MLDFIFLVIICILIIYLICLSKDKSVYIHIIKKLRKQHRELRKDKKDTLINIENIVIRQLRYYFNEEVKVGLDNIRTDLNLRFERDMYKIKNKVEEVVAHFEKDDRQRLIEYVEKSFEKVGKQFILERLKGKK